MRLAERGIRKEGSGAGSSVVGGGMDLEPLLRKEG